VSALIFGTIVDLEARVYDPKDPFRGQYIRLRYSHVPNETSTLEGLTIGQPIFYLFERITVTGGQQARYPWLDRRVFFLEG